MKRNHLLRSSRALFAAALVAVTVTSTGLATSTATTRSPATVSVAQLPAANAVTATATATATAVKIGTRTHKLHGTDRTRRTNELIKYGRYGTRTGTNRYGTEVAVVKGKVTAVQRRVGNMAVPTGGYVLSGHGTAAQWLDAWAKIGSTVTPVGGTTPAPTPTPIVTPTPSPSPTPTSTVAPNPGDSYAAALASVAGLTHYYPLDAANGARDTVGSVHGTLKGSGVTFTEQGAKFDGRGFVELPDHDDFSVATNGGFTVLAEVTVTDWRGAGASEYVHWMGKGVSGAHEWTFRHYILNGTGEASSRQGRVSFYHFNPAGGLGAGSYFQDPMTNTKNVVGATADRTQVQIYKNGALRDTDPLSGYNIVPRNTTTPVRIGSRGDNTGFLVGSVRRVAFFDRVLTRDEMQRLSDAASR